MSPILSSQGVVLATAMAAVSAGTMIILALRHHKSQFQLSSIPVLRPCLASGDKKGEKKKKKVRFAKDVVDPTGDSEEFRRQQHSRGVESKNRASQNRGKENRGMPENRAALYNGILRDRVIHRFGYSY